MNPHLLLFVICLPTSWTYLSEGLDKHFYTPIRAICVVAIYKHLSFVYVLASLKKRLNKYLKELQGVGFQLI